MINKSNQMQNRNPSPFWCFAMRNKRHYAAFLFFYLTHPQSNPICGIISHESLRSETENRSWPPLTSHIDSARSAGSVWYESCSAILSIFAFLYPRKCTHFVEEFLQEQPSSRVLILGRVIHFYDPLPSLFSCEIMVSVFGRVFPFTALT